MHTRLLLTADGVSVAVRVDDSRLPEVVHWGPAIGPLSAEEFDALALADVFQVGPNNPDLPPRFGILLEGRYGWAGRPGLVGSRSGRDWTPDWRVNEVLVDSDPAGELVTSGPCTVEFRAESEASRLSLVLTLQLTPEGLVVLRGTVTNVDDDAYLLDEFTLGLPVPSKASELFDFAGRWGVERFPQRREFTVGQHRREGRHGRTGADSAYVLHAGVPGFGFRGGEVWSVHTAWSGNHLHVAERDFIGQQVLTGGELLLPGEVVLGRDDSYATPELFFNYADGLDRQADRFHSHLRSLPHAPSSDRPVTLNVWEAVYFDHDTPRLLDLAERAAALGVERFVLDDGWFGSRRDDTAGLGDWVVAADIWPQGLHPLVDRVKDLGMEFGLWFEPEMVNLDSDLARAHPDWIMQPAGRLPVEARQQHVLNLSIEGAWNHVFAQMDAILGEYRIDYVKWDHNRDLIDAGTAPHGTPAVHAQTQAYYRLLDALRERHRGVEFESCSSGGARVDLEVMRRVERVWVSDVIDPQERQRMLPWTSQLLPPEFQGSHIASGRSHSTARWHDINFRAATAVFGHLGIEWDLAQASEEELAQLRWWIDWYKENRHVLLAGRQIRVDMREPQCYFKGVVTRQKAIFSLSLLSVSPVVSLGKLQFPGLDPSATYRVSVIDRQLVPPIHVVAWEASGSPLVLPGDVLINVGIRAPQMQPDTAVLFELDRV
ncbi:alpha-galactosidase [Tessaracoccus sp. Z1128]